MAKKLSFIIGSEKFEAGITKVDRDKVYGYVKVVVSDKFGNVCSTGNLLDDGQTLILTGATALKTVDTNFYEQDKKALKTVYLDGTDATLVPSSFDVENILEKASLDDLFNLEITTVYQLTWDDAIVKAGMLKLLEDGAVFRFVFNYRADYDGADAIVIASQNEVFVLTGRLLDFEYLENKSIIPLIEEAPQEEFEEELDFGML